MKLTNKHGLPEIVARAVRRRNAAYRSNADRSATGLIEPPQIGVLKRAHYHEIEKDLSEEFYTLLGSAAHQILEWGSDGEISEERLYARVNGWVVSGQMDLQHEEGNLSILDYKVTAAYSVTKKYEPGEFTTGTVKPEWEQQLNIYAYLLHINKGVTANRLSICAFIRDWNRREAQVNLDYPEAPIVEIPIPIWPVEKQALYVRQRVELHQRAVMEYEIGGILPPCTQEDRWAAPDRFGVRKATLKRNKWFYSEEEARAYGEEMGDYVLTREAGKSPRCGFCGVSRFCQQFKEMNATSSDEVNNEE